ncbi:MAG: RNA polymerase sigma factor [Chloroflexota bacterium]
MPEVLRDGPIDEPVLVDLIRRAQEQADSDAFDGLYQLYADRVFRYLLARLHNPDNAEEVTSQVFLRLIEKIDRYTIAPKDNVAIFSAWLYRMSHNKMIDHIRKQKRSRYIDLEYIEQIPERSQIVDKVEHQIDFEMLLQKLQLLNEQQRQVILFRFVEGLNIAETAQVMQKSEGAIKALQHRALENLKRFIQM